MQPQTCSLAQGLAAQLLSIMGEISLNSLQWDLEWVEFHWK